jgi:hypothetical protein
LAPRRHDGHDVKQKFCVPFRRAIFVVPLWFIRFRLIAAFNNERRLLSVLRSPFCMQACVLLTVEGGLDNRGESQDDEGIVFMSESAYSAKLGVSNRTDRPRIFWVEPIPDDYTLLPGDEFEIIVTDPHGTPWFDVVEWPCSTQIYIHDAIADTCLHSIRVIQNGNRLEPGHQRQKGLEAGLKY